MDLLIPSLMPRLLSTFASARFAHLYRGNCDAPIYRIAGELSFPKKLSRLVTPVQIMIIGPISHAIVLHHTVLLVHIASTVHNWTMGTGDVPNQVRLD